MKTLKEETMDIIANLKGEDIKFLNLLDRVGYEKVIKTITNDITKEKVKKIFQNITEEGCLLQKDDNIDIVQHLAFIENPFMKEEGFKEFYSKAMANSYTKSTYDNVYETNVIDGSVNLKEGYYKNIFNGLKIKIESGEHSVADLPRRTDRNKKLNDDKIILGNYECYPRDQQLAQYFTHQEITALEKQFVLYHELAHLSGSQIFSLETDDSFTRLKILHETHSDVCALIKIIKDNKLNQEESLALINDNVFYRSDYRHINEALCHKSDEEYTEHLTHAGLFTLRDFIKTDLNHIYGLKDDEISKFSTLLTEQAHQPSNIHRLENELGLFPTDKESLKTILDSELEEGNSFLAKVLKHYKRLYPDEDVADYTAGKIASDPYISLDLSIRILKLHDKEKLMTVTSPFSSVVNHTLKDDFDFFKKEYKENNVKLSKCFDYNELIVKTEKFKVKSWNN
jgi:hypothetical protein